MFLKQQVFTSLDLFFLDKSNLSLTEIALSANLFCEKAIILLHYSFRSFKYEAILQGTLLVKPLFLKLKNTFAHMHICIHSSFILQTDHFDFKIACIYKFLIFS